MVVPAGDALADFLLQPLAHLWILEPVEHRLRTALVRPRRDDAGEVVVAAGVGVDVRLDFDALLPRLVDAADDLAHLAPEPLVSNLEVQDLDLDAGPPTDLDHLLNRLEHLRALVADVRDEDAAV